MNSCLINTKKAASILFFIAFVVRLVILLFFDNNRVAPDGTGYHRISVNLVKGNGFSNQEAEPYERVCIREPGYPFFLAGIYAVVNIFHPVQYIKNYDINTGRLDKLYPEIVAAKTIQTILDSFGVVLLFFILVEISNVEIAFLTGLITATYFNLAFHSVYILRETFVMFLLLILNFFYLKYILKENKYLWLLLIGITSGLLILVFQIHVVILPVLFILLLVHLRSLKKAFISICFVTIVVVAIVLPQCINTYIYYPDIRVIKTFGSSFTYEMIKYDKAISFLFDIKLLSQADANKMRQWNETSKNQFERSFNGYYAEKADSLMSKVPAKYLTYSYTIKHKLNTFYVNFKKSFFLTKLGYKGGKNLYNTYGLIILIPLFLLPTLIGIMGIIGLLFFWKQYLVYFLSFIAYIMLFWLLGSEYRRMIILQPFLIFFGILFLNKILNIKGIYLSK